MESENEQSKSMEPGAAEVKPVEATPAISAQATEPKIVLPTLEDKKFARVSRRELLKVAPVLALGAFAIPRVQEWLLRKGLAFSDIASTGLFRSRHLAPTFADADVTPFEKFPINEY